MQIMNFNLHITCEPPIFSKVKTKVLYLNFAKILQNMSAQVHYAQNLFKSFKNFFLPIPCC